MFSLKQKTKNNLNNDANQYPHSNAMVKKKKKSSRKETIGYQGITLSSLEPM